MFSFKTANAKMRIHANWDITNIHVKNSCTPMNTKAEEHLTVHEKETTCPKDLPVKCVNYIHR